MSEARILIKLPAVDLDGHGAIDDGVHIHHCAKLPSRDLKSLGEQRLDYFEVEALCVDGIGSTIEGGPTSTSDVPEQGELRDDQHLSFDVGDRQGHLAFIVGEDSKTGDFVGGVLHVLRLVFARGAEVDE